jgi:DNA polymerase-3 subunit epsilon
MNDLAEKADVQWGSVSSRERIACKTNRRHDDRMTVGELQELREKYESEGFDPSHPFFEKHIVITGTLRYGTGKEVNELIAKVGGFPQENFNKKTNYLVVGYDCISGLSPGGKPTNKIEQSIEAKSKGQQVEVLDEQTFLDLLEK